MSRPQHMARTIAIACAAAAALAFAGLGLWLQSLDASVVGSAIEQAVHSRTGLHLRFTGSIGFSLFPGLRFSAGPAELYKQPDDPTPFISIDTVQASVGLLPLLRGSLVIREFNLDGLHCILGVDTDGRILWQTPPPPTRTARPSQARPSALPVPPDAANAGGTLIPAITVDSLHIRNSSISYHSLEYGNFLTIALASAELGNFAPGKNAAVKLAGQLTNLRLPKPKDFLLSGSVGIPVTRDQLREYSFSGTLGVTRMQAEGSYALNSAGHGGMPLFTGALRLGTVDMESLSLISVPRRPQSSAATDSGGIEPAQLGELDERALASLLQKVVLHFTAQADSIRIAGHNLQAVSLSLKADNRQVGISPCEFRLADGSARLDMKADLRLSPPRLALTANTRGMLVQKLLPAAQRTRNLTGALETELDLRGAGYSLPQFTASMQGTARMVLSNGYLPGMRIIPDGIPGLPETRLDIPITRAGAAWTINKGVARTNSIRLDSPALGATGSGSTNLTTMMMNYTLRISLPFLPIVPAVVSGVPPELSYRIDTVELLRNTARDVIISPGKIGTSIREGAGRILRPGR